MANFQVRVAFEHGGRMTFGVVAESREDALAAAGKRLAGLGGEVEIVPLDGPAGR